MDTIFTWLKESLFKKFPLLFFLIVAIFIWLYNLDNKINELKADNRELKKELKADNKELKKELKADNRELRKELKADNKEIKSTIKELSNNVYKISETINYLKGLFENKANI